MSLPTDRSIARAFVETSAEQFNRTAAMPACPEHYSRAQAFEAGVRHALNAIAKRAEELDLRENAR